MTEVRPAPEGIPSITAQQPIDITPLPDLTVEVPKPSLLTGVDIPPAAVPEVTASGYTFTEEAMAATGTELLKEGAKSLMAPEVPEYDYSSFGQVVQADQYGVQGSSPIMQMPSVGYGSPQVAYDSMYRPTSTWARRMGAVG